MTQTHNTKAAELHETTAKSHRAAADLHGKNDLPAAKEHASKALTQSTDAHKASVTAQDMSAAASK